MMRGFNIANNANESSLLSLAMTGCKICRIEVKQNVPADIPYTQNLAAQCAKFGMSLIPYCTMADPNTVDDWWLDRAEQWKSLPGFLAYDLVNELPAAQFNPIQYQALTQNIINRIRFVDKDKLLICQGWNGSIPDTWDQFLPPQDTNIIFSPHMYYDMFTTHQGVYPQYPAPVTYPSAKCNKDLFRIVLGKVKAANQKILIGEFSCARWTPGNGSYQWVRDCIDLFEEFQFGWLYHCWRAYQGWDAELIEGISQSDALNTNPWPTKTKTDTMRLIKLRIRGN